MPLVNVGVLGTPNLTVCPRCKSGHAFSRQVLTLTDSAVEVEPWRLVTCPACSYLAKHLTI